MTKQDRVIRNQYKNDENLKTRISLHARFSTNRYGWSPWVFDHFSFGRNARILEVGCGTGGLWAANHERIPTAFHGTLTDFSPGMVCSARSQIAGLDANFDFAVADAIHLPFPDKNFDTVIANHMLYHVPDRRRALSEIHRVLRPGGRVYTTTIGEEHMRDIWDPIANLIPNFLETRVAGFREGFTLQNGAAQIHEFFEDVQVDEYPDDLEVTEVEPIIDFYRASPTEVLLHLSTSQEESVRAAIAERIETHGAFHIHKSSGIIAATKA